jgi:cytochrome c-type biogenesis protein CcmH
MVWVALFALAVVAMAPLALGLRRTRAARGRRDAALALHRAQLSELDRDLNEGRLALPEHTQAVLEVQRRLLSAAATPDGAPVSTSRAPLIAVLVMVPLGALALYLVGGHPEMPAAPMGARIAAADAQAKQDAQLVDQLRVRLAALDPKSAQAHQGYIMLGNVEEERGDLAGAASAWRTALQSGFDPDLAAATAEAETRAQGHVTPESAALFRQALDAAAKDAPWRPLAEQRLAQAQGGSSAQSPAPGQSTTR